MPQRPGRAHDLALQRMGIVRLLHAPGRRAQIDEDAAVLDLDGECRDAVVLEARFAGSGGAVEFPMMPGADNVVAVEMAVAERPARMVAGIGEGAERAVEERIAQQQEPLWRRLSGQLVVFALGAHNGLEVLQVQGARRVQIHRSADASVDL